MSALGRMCLRFAACAALRGRTSCDQAVYDSEMKALELSQEVPVGGAIAVYTETDDGNALSAQNGGPPFNPHVELCLQITMQVRDVADDNTFAIGTPTTDDQLEFSIDSIEAQAEIALFRSFETNSRLFQTVAKRVLNKSSVRFVEPTSAQKLAMRYVTYAIEIDDHTPPVWDNAKTGLARLPEPFAAIAAQWAPTSPEYLKALAVAATLGPEPTNLLKALQATLTPPASTQTPGTKPEPNTVETWNFQPPTS